MQPNEATIKEFEKLGIEVPSTAAHGTEEDIRANLRPVTMTNWRLEGNSLKCDTEHGELSQTIPTDYILTGIGEDGLPILTKIVL